MIVLQLTKSKQLTYKQLTSNSLYRYPQSSHRYLNKAYIVNLKLLDRYSGPVLALWTVPPCEVVGGLVARCFVESRSLSCLTVF